MRRLSTIDLDKAILLSIDSTLYKLIKNNRPIAKETIESRNYIIKELNKRRKLWK